MPLAIDLDAGVMPDAGQHRVKGKADKHRDPVSYTHLRAHETVLDLVCRLLLEKKKTIQQNPFMDKDLAN